MQCSTSTSNMLVCTQPLLVVQSMIHSLVANPEVFSVSPDGDGLSSDCGGQEVGG